MKFFRKLAIKLKALKVFLTGCYGRVFTIIKTYPKFYIKKFFQSLSGLNFVPKLPYTFLQICDILIKGFFLSLFCFFLYKLGPVPINNFENFLIFCDQILCLKYFFFCLLGLDYFVSSTVTLTVFFDFFIKFSFLISFYLFLYNFYLDCFNKRVGGLFASYNYFNLLCLIFLILIFFREFFFVNINFLKYTFIYISSILLLFYLFFFYFLITKFVFFFLNSLYIKYEKSLFPFDFFYFFLLFLFVVGVYSFINYDEIYNYIGFVIHAKEPDEVYLLKFIEKYIPDYEELIEEIRKKRKK